MSIKINKEEIFAKETIESAGLTKEFKDFANNQAVMVSEAEKGFNSRMMEATLLSVGGLIMSGVSLPTNPTLASACAAVSLAGVLGVAVMELLKKSDDELLKTIENPSEFLKDKLKIRKNNDGLFEFKMESTLLEEKISENPLSILKESQLESLRTTVIKEVPEADLSEGFKMFAENNKTNHFNAIAKMKSSLAKSNDYDNTVLLNKALEALSGENRFKNVLEQIKIESPSIEKKKSIRRIKRI